MPGAEAEAAKLAPYLAPRARDPQVARPAPGRSRRRRRGRCIAAITGTSMSSTERNGSYIA